MSINFNHVTNDISASAGSVTIGGSPAGGGSWVWLSTVTASASATVSFTGIDATYDVYVVEMVNIIPASDSVYLYARTSTNGGSTYDSGASDYSYTGYYLRAGLTLTTRASLGDVVMEICAETINNDSFGGFSGLCYLYKPSNAATYFTLRCDGTVRSNLRLSKSSTVCQRLTAADVDAIRFYMGSGNITSGTFRLYGIKNS